MQKALAVGCFLFSVLCPSLKSQAAPADTSTIVYFMPFDVETYIPVTSADIASRAWEKWTISSKKDNDRLLAILNHGQESTFEQYRVRALVIIGQKRYVIDRNGIVQGVGSKGSSIDKSAFLKFRDQLSADQRHLLVREKF